MKTLDINFYFGFSSHYTAEDEATDIDFSDSLYNKLREVYIDSGETYLGTILEEGNLSPKQYEELSKIIEQLKEDLIEAQHDNGDDCDPDTGEEYDFSELQIDMEIVVPEDWEEN